MKDFKTLLSGGDARSTGNNNRIVEMVENQHDFDKLILLIFDTDRVVAMRAIDAVQKICVKSPLLLASHKQQVLQYAEKVLHKEIKWHIAQLIPLLCLNAAELAFAWDLLMKWAEDTANSKIVRVSAIQGLFELTKINPCYKIDLERLLTKTERENIPSINARIRHLRPAMSQKLAPGVTRS